MARTEHEPTVALRLDVLRKALVRAAERLGLNQAQLSRVIGVSESTMARIVAGSAQLDVDRKEGELALLLLRVFRSLDTVVGEDSASLKAWFHAENVHLGGVPAKLVQRAEGLVRVAEYLDGVRGTL
ncbi:MAG: antitoxin Xre-like helix-turn-helix domain-containing protein [Myxococcaceae bacterium]